MAVVVSIEHLLHYTQALSSLMRHGLLGKDMRYSPTILFNSGATLEMQQTDQSVLIGHDKEIEQAAFALKAMSHPLRLKIMCVLGPSEMSVQDIVDLVGTTQSNISQHLAVLREKGVLCTRKDANRVFYRIADPRTLKLMEMMREVFCGND